MYISFSVQAPEMIPCYGWRSPCLGVYLYPFADYLRVFKSALCIKTEDLLLGRRGSGWLGRAFPQCNSYFSDYQVTQKEPVTLDSPVVKYVVKERRWAIA